MYTYTCTLAHACAHTHTYIPPPPTTNYNKYFLQYIIMCDISVIFLWASLVYLALDLVAPCRTYYRHWSEQHGGRNHIKRQSSVNQEGSFQVSRRLIPPLIVPCEVDHKFALRATIQSTRSDIGLIIGRKLRTSFTCDIIIFFSRFILGWFVIYFIPVPFALFWYSIVFY